MVYNLFFLKFFIITDDNTLFTATVQVRAPFVTFYIAGGPLNLLLIPYGQPQSTIFSSPVKRDFQCGRGINNKRIILSVAAAP